MAVESIITSIWRRLRDKTPLFGEISLEDLQDPFEAWTADNSVKSAIIRLKKSHLLKSITMQEKGFVYKFQIEQKNIRL